MPHRSPPLKYNEFALFVYAACKPNVVALQDGLDHPAFRVALMFKHETAIRVGSENVDFSVFKRATKTDE